MQILPAVDNETITKMMSQYLIMMYENFSHSILQRISHDSSFIIVPEMNKISS